MIGEKAERQGRRKKALTKSMWSPEAMISKEDLR